MSYEGLSLTPSVPPLLIVLSGPSGVGKDATLDRMKRDGLPFHYVVTATTRPKRWGEKDSIDYYFLSEEEFRKKINDGQFLEWAKVYDNHYGVLKREVREALGQAQDTIVKVDVQGAATIKRILPEAVLIFLTPPSSEELIDRLKQRKTETSAELNLRISKIHEELKSLPFFDYVIVSYRDKLDLTISQINAIVTAEKCRTKPRVVRL